MPSTLKGSPCENLFHMSERDGSDIDLKMKWTLAWTILKKYFIDTILFQVQLGKFLSGKKWNLWLSRADGKTC